MNTIIGRNLEVGNFIKNEILKIFSENLRKVRKNEKFGQNFEKKKGPNFEEILERILI